MSKMKSILFCFWLFLAQGRAFSSSTPLCWNTGTQQSAVLTHSTTAISSRSPKYSFICHATLSQNEEASIISEEEEEEGYEDDDDINNIVDPTEIYEINLELDNLANQCARGGRNAPTLALKAFDLLQDMAYPDSVAYNSVLKAFAKTSPTMMPPPPPPKNANMNNSDKRWVSAAERAQHLLQEMCVLHEAQAKANQEWYVRHDNTKQQQQPMSDEEMENGPPKIRVKPNTRSFTTVMDAWSRTGNVPETLKVLQALEKRYIKSGKDVALRPNIVSYNTVLSAYAKSKGGQVAAEKAQQFLEDIMIARNIKPDAVSYNAVLHAWARSGVPQAGQEAETILREMPVAPNTRSFTTAIDAWSRSRTEESAMRAHGLLKELQELYDETEDDRLRPNCISYASVIHAYAVSKEPHKAQRAYALLQEMKDKGQSDPTVLPNVIAYNSVLNACATSSPLSSGGSDGGNLQTIVQFLYQELINNNSSDDDDEEQAATTKDDDAKSSSRKRQSLTPDHFTFGTVLKASANNLFWNDPTFCMSVFQEACKRGQVSLGVLIQLRQAVPMHALCEFLPPKAYNPKTKKFSMSHIPESWIRNVQERGGGDRKR